MKNSEIAPDGAFSIDENTNGITPLTDEENQNRIRLNTRFLQTASTHDKISDLTNQSTTAELSWREQNALSTSQMMDKKKNDNVISGKVDNKYTKQMGVDGAMYMIENKATTDQTLEYVREQHKKSPDWLVEVRNKKFYTQSEITQIVEKQKKEYIDKLKEQNLYNKTFLSTKGTTPVQHLDRIQHLITVSDRLDNMESRLTNLEIENLEFRVRLQLAEQNITVIDECLEISKQGKLLQCEALMKEGCTQKQIAEIMNLHINTIKGYYKEIKCKVQEGT